MVTSLVSPGWTGMVASLFSTDQLAPEPGPVLGRAIQDLAKATSPGEVYWVYLFVTPRDDNDKESLFPQTTIFKPGNVDRLCIMATDWEEEIGKANDGYRRELRLRHCDSTEETPGKWRLRDREVTVCPNGSEEAEELRRLGPLRPDGTIAELPDAEYVHISYPFAGNSLAFLEEAGVWLACRDWNAVRATVYWPLRSLLIETVAALTFAAFRASVHHYDNQQAEHDRNSEIAKNTTALVPHLRKLVYLIDKAKESRTAVDEKTRHMMNSTILERLSSPACHIPPRDERFVHGYTYKHDWTRLMVDSSADLASLANQVAQLILEYRHLGSGDKPLTELRKTNLISRFAVVHPCFNVLFEEDCERSLGHKWRLLEAFEILKDIFHRTFARPERELGYAALALWSLDRGMTESDIANLRPYFKAKKWMKRVPVEVLTVLDTCYSEIQSGGPVALTPSLGLSVGAPGLTISYGGCDPLFLEKVARYQERIKDRDLRQPTHSLEWLIVQTDVEFRDVLTLITGDEQLLIAIKES